jgi:hypothetical protein
MHAARAQPGEMPLADQQPGRRGLLLLRERASQRIALLPGARAHCISAGRSAAQHRGFTAVPTGIRVADVEIGPFLIAAPEKQELLRLIGTLV